MADPDERKLPLVQDFNFRANSNQWGYQKVDDVTVIERKKVPVHAATSGNIWMIIATTYDFGKFEATTITMPIGASAPDTMFVKDFSQIEGKQAIRDAHRALVELGGQPVPLEDVMGYTVESRQPVTVGSALKLKGRQP